MADRELVAEIAGRYLPAGVAARWLGLLRPAAALRYAGPGARVAAVLGGPPWLPGSVEWPAWEGHGPLSYIGTIDCSALTAVPLDIAVPQAGMLLFFYFDGQLDDGRAIVYSTHRGRPAFLPGSSRQRRGIHPGSEPAPRWPVPPGRRVRNTVQGPVESDAAVAALGGGEPGDDELLAEQARWSLLAQIDSDDRAGMMWGDAGTLYWLCRSAEMTGSYLPETAFTWQCC